MSPRRLRDKAFVRRMIGTSVQKKKNKKLKIADRPLDERARRYENGSAGRRRDLLLSVLCISVYISPRAHRFIIYLFVLSRGAGVTLHNNKLTAFGITYVYVHTYCV